MVYSWTSLSRQHEPKGERHGGQPLLKFRTVAIMSRRMKMKGFVRGSYSSRSSFPILIWLFGFSFGFNVELWLNWSLFLAWYYLQSGSGMAWNAAVPINTSYTVDIYVLLTENFPFFPVVLLTSSLCSGPLENSTVKLSPSKCQALSLACWQACTFPKSLSYLLCWERGSSPWHSAFFALGITLRWL